MSGFPVDDTTLALLRGAIAINPDTGHSHLHDFLRMGERIKSRTDEGDGVELVEFEEGHAPWHPDEVIIALIDEVDSLRAVVGAVKDRLGRSQWIVCNELRRIVAEAEANG